MIRPDLLGRAERSPHSINPQEQVVLGLAAIGAGLEAGSSDALETGMGLAAEGLYQIRLGSQYSERERLAFAIRSMQTLGTVKFDQLPPDGMDNATSFIGETWLILAAGMKTPIQERIAELGDEIVDNFIRLANKVALRDKTGAAPIEQLKHLYEMPSNTFTPDQRRRMAVIRADDLLEGEGSPQRVEILGFMMDQDREGFVDLTKRQFKKAFKNSLLI